MTLREFRYCIRLELEREKALPAYGRMLREFFQLFSRKSYKRVPAFPAHELLFIVITENHLKHFRPLSVEMKRQNRDFAVIFTSDALFQQYGHEWPGVSFSIHMFLTRRRYAAAILFQATLLARCWFSSAKEKAAIIRLAKPAYFIRKLMLNLLPGTTRRVALFKAEGFQANAVLLACRKLKVRTFAIQHGLIGDTSQISGLIVDTYLVWSDFFKKRLEKRQAGCNIQVTGNAAYDEVFRRIEQTELAPAPLRMLLLPNSGVSHTPLSYLHLLLETVLNFARENPEAIITVKPHPSDEAGHAKQYLLPQLASASNITLLERLDPIPYANNHLIVITNSGTGLEACIWRRPVLVYSPDWESVAVKQYIQKGVAEFADSRSGFLNAVNKIRDNYAEYQSKCGDFVGEQLAFQGHAAEKIVEELTC